MAVAITTAAICCTVTVPVAASASDITCISHQYKTIAEYEIFLGNYAEHRFLVDTVTNSDGETLYIYADCTKDRIEHYVDRVCNICGYTEYAQLAYVEYDHSNSKCPEY